MTGGNDDAANEDGIFQTQQPVSRPAAGHGQQIDGGGVRPIDQRRLRVGIAQPAVFVAGRHVQNEERPHAVVAETLPQFREKQGHQANGMAEKLLP